MMPMLGSGPRGSVYILVLSFLESSLRRKFQAKRLRNEA